MYVCVHRGQRGLLQPPLELELQEIVSISIYVLRSKFQSSERVASIVNHWAIQPQDMALIQSRNNSNGKRRPPRETPRKRLAKN